MYGKTEGSASPNAHALCRGWRPTSKGPTALLWNLSLAEGCLSAALPDAKKCSDSWAEEGARQRAAQLVLNSCLGSAVPSLNACHSFTEKFSMGKFWLCASWCLKNVSCWHQGSGGFSSQMTNWSTSVYFVFFLFLQQKSSLSLEIITKISITAPLRSRRWAKIPAVLEKCGVPLCTRQFLRLRLTVFKIPSINAWFAVQLPNVFCCTSVL